MTYTFTPAELRQLLEQALSNYRARESVYDFSPDALINTVERTLEGLTVAQADMDKRLENSPPYLDEDELSIHEDEIPFMGEPHPYETADNIMAAELGLMEF